MEKAIIKGWVRKALGRGGTRPRPVAFDWGNDNDEPTPSIKAPVPPVPPAPSKEPATATELPEQPTKHKPRGDLSNITRRQGWVYSLHLRRLVPWGEAPMERPVWKRGEH